MPTSRRTLKLGRFLTRKDRTQPTRGGGGGAGAFLLQNATWYVDARSYSGTGSLLDLSPNALHATLPGATNDPLFLPHTGTDYVYLPGDASNTVACTAPVGTASYAAYPLGGGAATTGAAAAGPFTFQTTGSWIRVDLLNGSAAVVASFDASAVPSPYSGVTDSFAVTWTVNRGATGRKSAVVDRPMFLFGVDDYLEVADNALLDFALADDQTVVVAARGFGSTTNMTLLAKKPTGAAIDAGWVLRRGSSQLQGLIGDGTSNLADGAGTVFTGATQVLTFVRNRTDDTMEFYDGTTTNGTTADPAVATLANADAMRIGRLSGAGTEYGDFEFLGAAVFRSALTAAQVARVVSELA